MKPIFISLCLALLAGDLTAAVVEAFTANVRGIGTFELKRDCLSGTTPIRIYYPDRGVNKGGIQIDEHEEISYTKHVAMEKAGTYLEPDEYTTYSNCVVTVGCSTTKWSMTYYLYPIFHKSGGLYGHEAVEASMPLWRQIYRLGGDREYEFRFVPDMTDGSLLVYLDGSLATRLPGTNRVVSVAAVSKSGTNLAVLKAAVSSVRQTGIEELAPIPHRANALLATGARLSLATGPQVIDGVPITVWDPSQSIDQGLHRQTTTFRNLSWNPIYEERTPWSVGPEYMQWSVPGKPWRYAWVLCADIPQTGREPILGVQLARFGSGCSSANVDFRRTSLADVAGNPNVRTVGMLAYTDASGASVETPLYLVRQILDIATLGKRATGASTLDFEFVGGGTAAGYPRSSVQVFGCSLEPAPYSFAVNNDVRGNIFEGAGRKTAGFDLTPNLDGVSGRLAYEIYDPLFKTLLTNAVDFALGKAGETRHFEIDLTDFPVGWYGMDYVFYDAAGEVVTRHASSFTVLAPDDREAGYESPYACWPQLDGYHKSNPDPLEQLEVMRKAGYRKTWHPPLANEQLCARWKVTQSSVGLGSLNPGDPTPTPADLTNRLDKAVASYKATFAAFPHCQVIQLLHEQGGRELCDEVAGDREPVRGAYAGWCTDWTAGKWRAYFCTEYCKRMRREFPDKRIMIGNGSSSSEMIASLVRDGFDLGLVDQLGIESKGFSSMPELNANLESPGMLWALRETARVFGYSNVTVNACNEYVFRPERTLSRTASPRSIMRVTDYTLRDYLISLAHGCDIISTGHLEDCDDAYYETNWGAAGQCTFYPKSYPKRMYTALAVLTRVLDKPVYRRRLPTGANTAYALEFLRDRSVKDYAYAFWTPRYGATLAVRFPAGASVRHIAVFGNETDCVADAAGEVTVEIGSTPCYLVATAPAESARVAAHASPEVPYGAYAARALGTSSVRVDEKPTGDFSNAYGIPYPRVGTFCLADVTDDTLGRTVIDLELKATGSQAAIRWEQTQLNLVEPYPVKLSEIGKLGLYVRGNGSFSMVQLELRRAAGHTGYSYFLKLGDNGSYVAFDGWQLMTANVPCADDLPSNFQGDDEVVVASIVCGSARKALNPVEMADVTEHLRLGPLVAVSRADAAVGGTFGTHVHEWSEWQVNLAPTCTESGVRTHVCTAAGCSDPPESETDEIAPLGHDWTTWCVDVPSTVSSDGHRHRACRRCSAREEASVPRYTPDVAYGASDTNAVTYAWSGGVFGNWSNRAAWDVAESVAYGIPSNGTHATAIFPAGVGDVTVDLEGHSFPTRFLYLENAGCVTLMNGTLSSYANQSKLSGIGCGIIALGAGTTMAYKNLDVIGVGSLLCAQDGGTLTIGGLRINGKATDAVLRSVGIGSLLQVTGTWGVHRLNAVGTRFEALDGGTLVYDTNLSFDNGCAHDRGTAIVVSNGTFRIAKAFCFGTHESADECRAPRISVSGRDGLFSATCDLTVGSAADIPTPPEIHVTFPPDGFSNHAPISTTKAAAFAQNVRFVIDATALGVPTGIASWTVVSAVKGVSVAAPPVLSAASVVCADGATGRLALSDDGTELNLLLSASCERATQFLLAGAGQATGH